jgi:PAS domain S-box-containing protein
VLGTFAMYYREPRSPSPVERQLIEIAVHIARIAIEHKQASEALLRSEEELRWKTAFLEAQVDVSIDGILVVDAQNKKILQNRRFLEIMRIPKEIAEEADDKKTLHFIQENVKNPDQFIARVTHLYAHPDETGRDEIELKDGTVLDRYSSPMFDKAGRYYGRIWTFRDITERKRTERALLESQALYHSFVEHMPAGVFRKDAKGRYIFVNSVFCRLKNMAPEEILGKTPEEIAAYEARVKHSEPARQRTLIQGKEHHQLSSFSPRKWRRSASWRRAWPMTSTTF